MDIDTLRAANLTNETGMEGDLPAKAGSQAVFLSYASEDARAAERICTALRAAGIEVWFDRSELRGGDAWAALDKYLRMDPTNSDMIAEKADLYDLCGRYEDALLIADSLLETDPENPFAAWTKARELLRLNRAPEAIPLMDQLIARSGTRYSSVLSLAAALHYASGDYAAAAKLAQTATTKMSEEALRNPVSGTVRLTLAAAEARLGHKDRARAALADFDTAVPNTKTIAAIKKWTYSTAFLSGYEPLYEGLRMAGVPE